MNHPIERMNALASANGKMVEDVTSAMGADAPSTDVIVAVAKHAIASLMRQYPDNGPFENMSLLANVDGAHAAKLQFYRDALLVGSAVMDVDIQFTDGKTNSYKRGSAAIEEIQGAAANYGGGKFDNFRIQVLGPDTPLFASWIGPVEFKRYVPGSA